MEKPRRSLRAYVFFCNDIRKKAGKYVLLSDLANMWNELKTNPSKRRELEYYNNLAKKDVERYNREIAIYNEENKEEILKKQKEYVVSSEKKKEYARRAYLKKKEKK